MNEVQQIDFEDMEASKPLPPDREMRRLHAILNHVETTAAWDAGCAWRVKILRFYGARVLRAIEKYEPHSTVTIVSGNGAYKEIIRDGVVGWSAYNNHTGATEFLKRETARQAKSGIDPWGTAKEYKRRKDDIRKLYRGE